MRMLALMADTFREIYAKKVIIGIVLIQIFTLVITGIVLFSDGMQRTYREVASGTARPGEMDEDAELPGVSDSVDAALLAGDSTLPFDSLYADTTSAASKTFADTAIAPNVELRTDGTAVLNDMVKGQMGAYAGVVALAVVFLGIFATASIVPSMMEKGAIDLLLSKPLPRTKILFGRALGGVLAIAINLAFFVVALWLLYGFATGVWHLPFLIWTFAIPLFTFVVIYSGVILLNVHTESWVLPMSLAYVHLMILGPMLYGRENTLFTFIESTVLRRIIEGLYYILPQTSDMLGSAWTTVYTSSLDDIGGFVHGLVFIIVALAWSAWKFQRKDF